MRVADLSLFFLLTASTGEAQDGGIKLERVGALILEADPGTVLNVPFRISNNSGAAVKAKFTAELPNGWRHVAAVTPVLLQAGASDVWLLSVAIRRDAPAGRHLLRIHLNSESPGKGDVSDSVTVTVRKKEVLKAFSTDAPPFAIAGESFEARFVLLNHGNASRLVHLSLRSSLGFVTTLDSSKVSLVPGGQSTVTAVVRTNGNLHAQVRHRLELRTSSETGEHDSSVATVSVDVFPRVSSAGTKAPGFPLTIGLRATESGSLELPAMISGSGTLGGNNTLELLLRRTRPAALLWSERDEYRVGLTGTQYELRMGDNYYALSPLTESGRYGFGGSGRVDFGRFGVAAMLRWDRRNLETDSTAGVSVGLLVGRDSRINANFVTRRDSGRSDTWSLRTRFAPFRSTAFDLEYANGNGPQGEGSAYAATVTGNFPALSYHLRYADSEPAFPLRNQGVASAAGLALRPGRGWKLEGSWNVTSRERLDLASSYAGVLTSTSSRLAVANRSAFLLEYKKNAWTLGDAVATGRESQAVGVRFGLPLKPLLLSPGGEVGLITDQRTGEQKVYRRLELRTDITLGKGQTLSARIEQLSGGYAAPASQPVSAFIDGWFRLRSLTTIKISSSQTLYAETMEASSRRIDARVEQELPFGHRLIGNIRMFASGVQSMRQSPAYQVEYEIPLRLPLPQSSSAGTVELQLIDAENGKGIANVPVTVGNNGAVSDRRGRAIFSRLEPGQYSIQYDRGAIGLGRVSHQGAPRMVEVSAGASSRITLRFVKGVSISGSVNIYEWAPGSLIDSALSRYERSGGLGTTVVELSGAGEVHRRVTDTNGSFDFANIPPGPWVLSVRGALLPAQHFVERDSTTMELLPGGHLKVEFRVLPRRRQIRMAAPTDVTIRDTSTLPPVDEISRRPDTDDHIAPSAHPTGAEARTVADVIRKMGWGAAHHPGKSDWPALETDIRGILNTSTMQEHWTRTRLYYETGFRKYLDRIASEQLHAYPVARIESTTKCADPMFQDSPLGIDHVANSREIENAAK